MKIYNYQYNRIPSYMFICDLKKKKKKLIVSPFTMHASSLVLKARGKVKRLPDPSGGLLED